MTLDGISGVDSQTCTGVAVMGLQKRTAAMGGQGLVASSNKSLLNLQRLVVHNRAKTVRQTC